MRCGGCRRELERDTPPPTDPDAVPVVLAREIGYDVALLELAEVLGIETDPSRFEQPRRARPARAGAPGPGHHAPVTPRQPQDASLGPGLTAARRTGQVPVASVRVS